ncbi:hypothetical protein KYJ26_17410 [Bacillus sp. MCCB 382]|nr:hypothetical protein [Bacillus sp. MCCB 382]
MKVRSFIILPFFMAMPGVYPATVGLLELRIGADRKKYSTYMFAGIKMGW